MIQLKSWCIQAGGDFADTWLSAIEDNGVLTEIRERQDFELFRAHPIEFKDASEAIKFLDERHPGRKHYVFGATVQVMILASSFDSPNELYKVYEIERV